MVAGEGPKTFTLQGAWRKQGPCLQERRTRGRHSQEAAGGKRKDLGDGEKIRSRVREAFETTRCEWQRGGRSRRKHRCCLEQHSMAGEQMLHGRLI